MSDTTNLGEWIGNNSVRTIRAQTVTLDGALVGKHLSPKKFESGAQSGWGFADIALAVDLGNTAQLGFDFGDWRGEMHDVFLRPDLTTLSTDASLPGLATVMCDLVDQHGAPLPVCSRSTLARVVKELAELGFTGKAAVEIEATVFDESIEQAREQRFTNLHPLGGTQGAIYLLSRSRDYTTLMDAMAARIERAGIPWEGWADESAHGQIEVNLPPTDILTAADWYVRTKQIMREVAYEHVRSIWFLARWSPDQFGQGAHINLSLQQDGRNAFFDEVEPSRPSETMRNFIGGVLDTMAAASSFQYPTVNSYRRIAEFDGPPTTVTWGVDNKSAASRTSAGVTSFRSSRHFRSVASMSEYSCNSIEHFLSRESDLDQPCEDGVLPAPFRMPLDADDRSPAHLHRFDDTVRSPPAGSEVRAEPVH